MKYHHIPVLLDEVIKYLNPQAGGKFIDCTLGGGGYTFEIAKRIGDSGKVIALDLDDLAIKNAKILIKKNKNKNIILNHGNFKNLQAIINKISKKTEPLDNFNGIVFDLGLSSAQLEDRNRGFSFLMDTPLDMAFGRDGKKTTDIINKYSEDDLIKIFKEYGEEKFAKPIAKKIVIFRKKKKITTTKELAELVQRTIPKKFQNKNIHPATKVFQALRIATNDELTNLEKALPQAIKLLKKGGRIAVVSFHSLEDRIVKNYFKKESKDCLCPPKIPVCQCHHKASLKIINKKIITPSDEEIKNNPRARSAKLRVAEKK